jgi:hypothetical protein
MAMDFLNVATTLHPSGPQTVVRQVADFPERQPPQPDEPKDEYFLGLDLGQSMDFTALVALRRRETPDPDRPGKIIRRYVARGIKRWPLKTPYTTIVPDVVDLVSRPPLAGCTLGVDRTGCGQPVVDMLRAARPQARVVPIFITAGHQVTAEGGGWNVPKSELCSCTNVVTQQGRLEIPATLPEAETLGRELQAFRAKVSNSGREVLEADWRERQHDDLVLALAIAAWLGERGTRRLIVFA